MKFNMRTNLVRPIVLPATGPGLLLALAVPVRASAEGRGGRGLKPPHSPGRPSQEREQ